MPRPKKGARLWLRAEQRRDGKLHQRAMWFIKDAGRLVATGCAADETEAAEQKLVAYLAGKYEPERKARDIERIDVADVLSIYHSDTRDKQANPVRFDGRIQRLALWWGGKMLSEVTGANCRAYAEHRGKAGGARRDLEDLRAAINHHSKEGLHRGVVRVVLPQKGAPRERWLTRDEAAHLLWVCWRAREEQTIHRGPRKGQKVLTDRRPLRHIARFILIGLYTGTRAGAVATASPVRAIGRSWVDLERGIFYRLAEGKRATNKRQPPVPIPPNLLSHLRRWHRLGIAKTHFVEWNGNPVQSVKTGFKTAVRLAALGDDVVPHTLRHTAATWLMQAGVEMWEAAGFLGMSVEMLEKVYGHHSPHHLRNAATALRGRR